MRRVVPIVLLAALVVSRDSVARSVPADIPPEKSLSAAGLSIDEASLIRYLEQGIPPGYFPVQESRDNIPFVTRRWGYYGLMATVLAKMGSQAAIPVLEQLQAGALPPILDSDLDLCAAALSRYMETVTWEEWDTARERLHDGLRLSSARALSRITGTSSVPFELSMLEKWTPAFLNASESGNDIQQFYYGLCKSLTMQGSPAGIDTFIATFDSPQDRINDPIVSLLQQWTGQTFGPEYDDSPRVKAVEIGKWKSWWAANRATFQPNVANMQQSIPFLTPYPAPTSLRDRVWHAENASMDYDNRYFGRQSIAWLEENGHREVRKLLAIVEDEDERLTVRGEALMWYVKFAKNPSYKMLLGYATAPDPGYFDMLANNAMKLIGEHFPEKSNDALKQIAASGSNAAENAATLLSRTPEGIAFLQSMEFDGANGVLYQLSQQLARSGPAQLPSIEAGLLSGDAGTASYAAIAAERTGVENQLSPEAKTALAQWEADPEFLFRVLQHRPEQSTTIRDFDRLLESTTDTGPKTAVTLLRAGEWFRQLQPHIPNLTQTPGEDRRIELALLEQWLRCVEAFRASRGRAPLPEYEI